MVFNSITIAISLGVFSTEKMVRCGFSVTLVGLGFDLPHVSQHGYGIACLNHGISGCGHLVCVRGEDAWALVVVYSDDVGIKFFSHGSIPGIFAGGLHQSVCADDSTIINGLDKFTQGSSCADEGDLEEDYFIDDVFAGMFVDQFDHFLLGHD